MNGEAKNTQVFVVCLFFHQRIGLVSLQNTETSGKVVFCSQYVILRFAILKVEQFSGTMIRS